MSTKPCSVEGCPRKAHCRTLCNAHYQRYLRYGDATYYPPPKSWQHGTNSGYTYHRCRCEACREAHAEANRRDMRSRFGFRGLVDAGPAKEQIACLVSFGLPARRISKALGKAHQGVPRIRTEKVRAATEEAIAGLHWGLWRTHGPFRRHCRCEVPEEVAQWLESA